MLPGHTRASLLGEAEVMLKITVVEDGKKVFPSSGNESTNRPARSVSTWRTLSEVLRS
jgi:hypothetical protein